jgi:excisionase family DNA binding protein
MSYPVAPSLKEVAFRLGVPTSFVYKELERGRLGSLKLGKRRLGPVSDLDA